MKGIRLSVCALIAGLMAASVAIPAQAAEGIGTPAYTAAIAQQKGTFDVAGLKLGMPITDAIKLLKARDPNYSVVPAGATFGLLPKMNVIVSYFIANKTQAYRESPTQEDYELDTTTAPSAAFVWGIVRRINYVDKSKEPLISTIVAGLRKKYGPETTHQLTGAYVTLEWYIDKDGNPAPLPAARHHLQCTDQELSAQESQGPRTGNHVNPYLDDAANGRGNSNQPMRHEQLRKDDADPYCQNVTAHLIARMHTYDNVRPVSFVELATNFKLAWAGFQSTHQALVAANAAQKQKELQNAAHQSGPQL